MDLQTQTTLNRMTARFYRTHASSFSATRQAPWHGWRRALDVALPALDSPKGENRAGRSDAPLTVLDLACGNLRYERFLADALPARAIRTWAVDNADALAADAQPARAPRGGAPKADGKTEAPAAESPSAAGAPANLVVSYQHLDIVAALIASGNAGAVPLSEQISAPACDLAVAFGFFHHVPGAAARTALLDAVLAKTRPGGCVIASLWRFMESERLAAKARATTAQAQAAYPALQLEKDDYLLGWQDAPGAYRYCHHFGTGEVDLLAAHARERWGCRLLARFSADGKAGNLNTYLVLQRPR